MAKFTYPKLTEASMAKTMKQTKNIGYVPNIVKATKKVMPTFNAGGAYTKMKKKVFGM